MSGTNDKEMVLVIGSMFVVIALVLYIYTRKFLKTAIFTTGEVVGYGIVTGSSAGVRNNAAVIQFFAKDRAYKFSEPIVSTNAYFIGRSVNVVYDPADPLHAHINGLFYVYSFEIVFAFVGACMIMTGLFGY